MKTAFALFGLVWFVSISNAQTDLQLSKIAGITQAPNDIVINEIDTNTNGKDTLEFIELFDGGYGNTSLNGLCVVFYNGSNCKSYLAIDLSNCATNSEGYFVIGNKDVEGVNLIFDNDKLQNGPDAIVLYKGNAADFNKKPVTTDNLLDAVVYGDKVNVETDLTCLLNEGETSVFEGSSKKGETNSLQRMPNGVGGRRNSGSFRATIPTPGKNNNLTTGNTFSVVTTKVENVNCSSVKCFCSLLITGDSPINKLGVCWNAVGNPNIDDYKIESSDAAIYDNYLFNQYVSGLEPNSTYYVRAYAVSSSGEVAYGNVIAFKTLDSSNAIANDQLLGIQFDPNPVSDGFHINSGNGIQLIKIYTTTGKLVKSVMIDGTDFVDVHYLSPGVYLIQAGGKSYKFIKR